MVFGFSINQETISLDMDSRRSERAQSGYLLGRPFRIRSNPLLIQIQQTIATTPAKDGHGNEWSKPDFTKTLADHANDGNNNNQKPLSDDLKSRLATFITDYGSEDREEPKSMTHYNAMQASRVFQDTLKSDKTCQVKLPESWWGGA